MNLKNQLQFYTLLSISFLQLKAAKAQIIHQGFEPDLRMMNWEDDGLLNDTISIDIDSNGIDDLIFYFDIYSGLGGGSADMKVSVEIDDAVTGLIQNSGASLNNYQFSEGQIIHPDLTVLHEGKQLYIQTFDLTGYGTQTTNYGSFHSNRNYMGLELNFDSEIHYGWLRLTIPNVNDKDIHFCKSTSSPLVISEFAYNAVPDSSIVCGSNELIISNTIKSLKMYDGMDINTVEDLIISFQADTAIDYSELRIFLIPSREQMIPFSIDDALNTDYYFSIPAEEVVLGELNTFQFPEGSLDVNGDAFSPYNFYSGFLMKMPIPDDTSALTLSNPLNVVKPALQRCLLAVSGIDMLYDPSIDVLHVDFNADVDESDIGAYGAGLVAEWELLGWSYYGLFYDELDTVDLIMFPKTGETEYSFDVPGITKDIYGFTISTTSNYYPVIFGFGDGYYRDLFCLKAGDEKILVNTSDLAVSNTQIQVLNTNILQTLIFPLIPNEYYLDIKNIYGVTIIHQVIQQEKEQFNFPDLSSGIYIATILHNNSVVASAKYAVAK